MSNKTISEKYDNVDSLNNQSWENRYTSFEESICHAEQALGLSQEIDYEKGIAYAKLNLATCHFLKSRNEEAFPLLQIAMQYFIQHPNEKGYVSTLMHIGNIFEGYGDYEKALDFTQKALSTAKETNYIEGEGDAQSVLGMIYIRLADYKSAQEAYIESLRIREKLGNQNAIASSLNRLAQSFTLSGEYNKALEYYSKSKEIRENIKKHSAISWTYLGMGSTHEYMANLDIAKEYYTKGLGHEEADIRCKAQCLIGSGRVNRKLNLLDEAKRDIFEAQELVETLKAKPLQYEIYLQLAKCFEKEGKTQEAFDNYKKYHKLKEEVHNNESSNRLKNQQIVFAIEKSEKEKEIFQLRNVELKSALDEIAEKNKEITDSIHYAKRIQSALLPKDSYLKEILPDHFILFLPKDIVSGDFYWATHIEGKTVIVAADSTGHGVPGAFMSMLGASFLDNIVNVDKILDPAKILDSLREHIMKALKQRDEDIDSKDGMDLAICVYDETNSELAYAGAYNPLCLIRNGEFKIISADRMPVGIHSLIEKPFTNNIININKGDIVYIFSDGFQDQFGGEKGKKLKLAPFLKLLQETSINGMEKQKQILYNFFNKWKGAEPQLDDVVVIGIKF